MARYYFGVSAAAGGADGAAGGGLRFPLRVRFNIVNMQKSNALYNYGMKVCPYLGPHISTPV